MKKRDLEARSVRSSRMLLSKREVVGGLRGSLNACIAMAFLQDNEGHDEGLDDDPALEAWDRWRGSRDDDEDTSSLLLLCCVKRRHHVYSVATPTTLMTIVCSVHG